MGTNNPFNVVIPSYKEYRLTLYVILVSFEVKIMSFREIKNNSTYQFNKLNYYLLGVAKL